MGLGLASIADVPVLPRKLIGTMTRSLQQGSLGFDVVIAVIALGRGGYGPWATRATALGAAQKIS